MTDPVMPTIQDFAQAIASAEGFGKPGSVPTRAHNPGDLIVPDWTGPKQGAEGISVFATDDEGWQALFHELALIAYGHSRVYTLDMTIAEMAAKWTDTQQVPWASNVVAWYRKHGRTDITTLTTLRVLLLGGK